MVVTQPVVYLLSSFGGPATVCIFNSHIKAVYTRENKLNLAAAYIIRERNYLYGVFASYVSRGQSKPWLIFSRINGPNV